ncbi:DEAD/DEAH box helicase [Aureispira anguillae]|uniref:DEAD/DEAH box helicase n=1 Tax=Aureispira anguillae TaxID=2864201 RepID=A0A915YFA9_9BACT|nr:DEAD/DEAH box helicase [Aureispira anguillae]BDS12077.1 DEAD/DEAH box helicase [Aureispira anguillae]
MKSNKNTTENILKRLQIDALNDMQQAMETAAQSAKNIVLLSPTGSGKTLAFLLSLLKTLEEKPTPAVQALILVPSRELALQITQVFRNMQTGFKVNCCYGGHPIKTELQNLQIAPTLLVGTPGRIADHLRRESFATEGIKHLILDEFDKSLELGFAKEMSFIIEQLHNLQRRFLTSATTAVEVPDFVHLEQPTTLNFLSKNQSNSLTTKALITQSEHRVRDFIKLVNYVGNSATLIFCNQRATVEKVSHLLFKKGIIHGIFHGGLEQKERELALIKFRNGSHNILVTTDLAARGLDIPTIQNIIHYQLPHTEAEFIHRNGRTARMEARGTAYLILEEDKPWRTYIDETIEYIELPLAIPPLKQPEWQTLYISAGKKDKVNKFDIVGTLFKKGQLQKEDLGLVVVKEYISYVAVKQNKTKQVIKNINKQRIKKKKVLIELAR